EILRLGIGVQQPFHPEPQRGIAAACLLEIVRPPRPRFLLERGEEDRFHLRRTGHGTAPLRKVPLFNATNPLLVRDQIFAHCPSFALEEENRPEPHRSRETCKARVGSGWRAARSSILSRSPARNRARNDSARTSKGSRSTVGSLMTPLRRSCRPPQTDHPETRHRRAVTRPRSG